MKKLLTTTVLLASFSVLADTANISWTPPTERTDGTPLPQSEIAGYYLYVDKIQSPTLITDTSTSLSFTGTKIINLTTIDTEGRESQYSPDISISGKALPNYPDVTITITIEISGASAQ